MGAVAEKLGVHETTVGRAVSGKYARTPQGVFELRFFFTGGLATADGGTISTEAVKEAVAKAVQKNPKFFRRAFTEGATQAGAEGVQEVGQQALQLASHAIVKEDPTLLYNEEARKQYVYSLFGGAVLGGGMGMSGEAMRSFNRGAVGLAKKAFSFRAEDGGAGDGEPLRERIKAGIERAATWARDIRTKRAEGKAPPARPNDAP